jgi:hypothetical protein
LASVTVENFEDAEAVLGLQDQAFEIMENAKIR